MPILDREFVNLAIVRTPLNAVAHAFHTYPAMRVKATNSSLDFPTQPYSRSDVDVPMLLWSPATAPELTAFMPSVSSGDYFFTSYCVQFKFEVIELRSTTSLATTQVNEFVAYAGGTKLRVVQALQDSPRWVFFQKGEPLPFEAMEQYQSRLVKHRLTRDTVLTYAESWGAPVRSPGFWETTVDAMTFVKNDG